MSEARDDNARNSGFNSAYWLDRFPYTQPPLDGVPIYLAVSNFRQDFLHVWIPQINSWIDVLESLPIGPSEVCAHPTEALRRMQVYGRGKLFEHALKIFDPYSHRQVPLPQGVERFSVYVVAQFDDRIDSMGVMIRKDMRRPPGRRKGPPLKLMQAFKRAMQLEGDT
jgi:hypothetical protein